MSDSKLSFLKRVWLLTRPYWKSEERWMARLLLVVIVGLTLGDVYLHVLFNDWNNGFYNSLQNLDKDAFIKALIRYSYLVIIFIVVGVYRNYLARMLHIKWRRWMTARYLSHWLDHQNYYRMQLFGSPTDNPDQRISEDVDQFIILTLDLTLGGLNSVVTLFSFLSILWTLSGALDFTVYGYEMHIPGYMVWVAFLYAFLGTWITFRIGKPLIKLTFDQQRFEADFRYSLVRLRENSENIAFYKGEAQEKTIFASRFASIFDNWWQIMKRKKKLQWFTIGYGEIANVFPYIVIAPRFFAQKIKLGGLMQTADAFGYVENSLSYLIEMFTTGNDSIGIANWRAVTDRLSGFNESIRNADAMMHQKGGVEHQVAKEKIITAEHLTVRLPDGKALLENADITLRPGDSLLITGISGTGKSTLLRAFAGIWPFVEGKITMPEHARMLFLPQKPYLPLGAFKEVLCYPEAVAAHESEIKEILQICGLEHLAGRLEETDQWSNVLSLGEQQRVAFARVLITKPDFAFLDEATSALDTAAEAHLYGLLKTRLPQLALVSVGHHDALHAWHSSELALGAVL